MRSCKVLQLHSSLDRAAISREKTEHILSNLQAALKLTNLKHYVYLELNAWVFLIMNASTLQPFAVFQGLRESDLSKIYYRCETFNSCCISSVLVINPQPHSHWEAMSIQKGFFNNSITFLKCKQQRSLQNDTLIRCRQ